MLQLHKNHHNRFMLLLLFSCLFFGWLSMKFMYLNSTVLLEINIFSMSSVVFPMMIIMDKLSISFGFVVTLISSCVFFFGSKYMAEDPFYNRFIIILLSFVISMNLLIFSGSIFVILMGWDGLGISSFALIVYYQNKESLKAGMLTLIINRLGDVIIVSSMFLFLVLGQMSIFPVSKSMLILMLVLTIASLTKSAQYPFSSWLPAAMAAPTPVSALVHSSTLVTAGVYLVIRLSINTPLSTSITSLLCYCGSITCLLGGMAAICEMDLKKMIALSTLSQLGVMMFSLSMNYPHMALFHLYTHAMFKALLFLVAGVVLMMSFGTQDLRLLGGVMLTNPILIVFQNVSSLCLIGAPFLSAFYSKHSILELMMMSNLNLMSVVLMFLATICTTIYVIRSLKVLCWGNIMINLNSSFSSISIFLPLMVLMIMGIISGKLFLFLNESVIVNLYLPSLWWLIINIITIMGMILSFFMVKLMKSHSLSTLFYLTPMWNSIIKPYFSVSKNLNSLDYGWLEPKYISYPSFMKMINILNNIFLWPKNNFSLLFILILCLSLMF